MIFLFYADWLLEEELDDMAESSNDFDTEIVIPDSIYRLGHSDKWACKNCNLRDDKWCMVNHQCRNQLKPK